MVVDIKFVAAVAGAHVPGVADIDIEPAVVIDVGEYDAGAPHAVLFESGFAGDVFEFPVAFIEKEFVVAHVGREEDIGEAVVVDVADGYAAAVVEVAEEETVVFFPIFDGIGEFDTGVFLELEQGVVVAGVAAGYYEEYGEYQDA